jgi:hypothetical protein
MKLILFLAVVAIIAGTGAMLATMPLWFDRVIVFVMRRGQIYLFPTAIRLALSLETQEDEWQLDGDKQLHPSIGKVWLVSERMVRIELPNTNQSKNVVWEPGWIERRIIRDAATGLKTRRLAALLDRSLPHLPM